MHFSHVDNQARKNFSTELSKLSTGLWRKNTYFFKPEQEKLIDIHIYTATIITNFYIL